MPMNVPKAEHLRQPNSPAHRFVLLFDVNGAQAFGALGGKDNDAAFFGRPSPAEQEGDGQAAKE